ncbi:MAG: hypothetical protein KAW12_30665 [Candidatus Aminicenantes bacterium]|nr:hypothetical protein [Candidatus Aminicenantes bacterium]
MDNVLNMSGFPPEAKESIINFYEFIKHKYKVHDREKSKSKKKLLTLMEKGIYTLPDDYVFNREELYD